MKYLQNALVLAKCPAFLKPHSLGLTLHFPSACLIVYAVQLPDDPAGISYGYAAGRYGVRSRVDLHVGCYHHPVPDINPVVVHEGAVHIDDDAVAQEDILSIFDKLFLKAEYGMWSSCKNCQLNQDIFRPTMDAMSVQMKKMRANVTGSWKKIIPTATVPTAPMPVHTG